MAKPVILSNGRSWKTQLAAKEHFKAMLHRYSDGDEVPTSSPDHSDLLALLEKYDSGAKPGEEKCGEGVLSFFKARDVENGGTTSCFYVKRLGRTPIDFSVYKAIEFASKNP